MSNQQQDEKGKTTYIYNSVEVKVTGRTASKEVEKVNRLKRRTEGSETVMQTLHEVTPANSEDGSWKKWVHLAELHTIDVSE